MPDEKDTVLGRLAVERGYVSQEQLDGALDAQRRAREELGMDQPLVQVLLGKHLLTADQAQEVRNAAAMETGEARLVAGYEVISKLGQGGMGAVYRAKSATTGQYVALKILPPSLATPDLVKRFEREAKVVSSLDHENIVGCVEFGYDPRRKVHFCALELIEGEDLDKRIARLGVLPEEEAVSITLQVTEALQHAFWSGLVHRDIKPANIMVTADGTAKLLDLGLARSANVEVTRLTQTGAFVGSPYYASPEQATGERDIDIRSDIYSLGCTLYHMVTGKPPFGGTTVLQVLQKHLTEKMPWPKDANPALSDALCRIIAKMMAKSRADRYAEPKELLADLHIHQAGGEPEIGEEVLKGSSVAVPVAVRKRARERRRAAQPARESGRAAVADRPSDARRERRVAPADAEPGKKAPPVAMIAAGALVAALVLGLGALMMGGKKKSATPQPPPGEAGHDAGARPSPDAHAQDEREARSLEDVYASLPPSLMDGLVGWWKFDEGEGNVAHDSSARGNDGLIRGANWVKGRTGGALSFDADGDYVYTGRDVMFSGPGATSFTVSVWAKSGLGGTGERFICDRMAETMDLVAIYRVSSAVFFRIRGLTGHLPTVMADDALSGNAWTHIAGVRDTGDRSVKLYVDGVLSGSTADTSTGEISPRLCIGAHTAAGLFWDGLIDDFRAYDRALSPEEIKALASMGSAQPVAALAPSSRDAPAALEAAEACEAANPNDAAGAIARYEKVAADFRGTREAAEAEFGVIRLKARPGPTAAGSGVGSAGIPADAVEFGGHRYKLYEQKMTWHDAKAFCERQGGHLVTVTSKEEDDFAIGVARRGDVYSWIGFTDEGQEGRWRWITGEAVTYERWADGQPDNWLGSQNVGVYNGQENWHWDDSLHGVPLCFICEWEPAPPERAGLGPPGAWRPVFDGRTTDFMLDFQRKDWKVEGGALASLPGKSSVLRSEESFGDGDTRVVFEITDVATLVFNFQLGPGCKRWVEFNRPQCQEIAGARHELLCVSRGDDVTVTLDGAPVEVRVQGAPTAGAFLFYVGPVKQGFIKIYSIEFREPGPERGGAAAAPGAEGAGAAPGAGEPPRTLTLDLGGGVTMEFVYIEPGVFTMGGDEDVRYGWQGVEKPKHEVAITRGFYIGRYEVTRGQFAAFVKATGYRTEAEKEGKSWGRRADGSWGEVAGASWRDPVVFAQDDTHPVVAASWNDAKAFCEWASAKTRRDARLPTEAEWEYACRAGPTGKWCFGDDEGVLGEYAWYDANSNWQTHPVGRKKPNGWGLFDLHGSVWEWVADAYDASYYAMSPREDPPGPAGGGGRLIRGGSWNDNSQCCRSAFRSHYRPSNRFANLGFRAVVSSPPDVTGARPAGVELTRGLVGWWKFDEGAGATARDSSGKGNDGKLVGNPKWTAGRVGGALELDGRDDCVDCGNPSVFASMKEYAVAAWVRPDDSSIGVPYFGDTIAGKEQSGRGFQLTWDGRRFGLVTLDLGQTLWSNAGMRNGTWYHLVGSWSAADGIARLYVDGALEAEGARRYAPNATQPLKIGAYIAGERYYAGAIDDVRIYDRALSAGEIAALARGHGRAEGAFVPPEAQGPVPASDASAALLAGFDSLVEKGDLAGARQWAEREAAKAAGAPHSKLLQAAAGVAKALDDRAKAIRRGAEALVGNDAKLATSKETLSGNVGRVTDDGIVLEIKKTMRGMGTIETKLTVKWSDLAPGAEADLARAGGWRAEGADGAMAECVLALSRKDEAAARAALARAGDHPLAAHYRAKLEREEAPPAAAPKEPQESKQPAPTLAVDLGRGVTMDLIYVKPGRFRMGLDQGAPEERPARDVEITRGFYIGKHEVTQVQATAVFGSDRGVQAAPNEPAPNVSWLDATEFCRKASALTRMQVRLPTEAEWEYAARAGSTGQYYFGNDARMLDDYAWHAGNAGGVAHAVGGKRPNAWGLHDTHGNVWEWVADWFDAGYYANAPARDPTGPATGTEGVLRGGSWFDPDAAARSSFRFKVPRDRRNSNFGLRAVVSFAPGQ